MPAAGGTASIGVTTERECQWTASPEGTWLKVMDGASGQGPGTVQVSAAPNTDPATRTAAVVVNNQRVQFTQEAAQCQITLGAASASFPGAGGTGSVEVRASNPLCTWTAASEVDWIAITSGSNGKGSTSVSFNVSATSGSPRTGTLKIAGLSFTVNQSEGCTYAIAPAAYAAGSAGGSMSVTVTAAAGCPWTAVSNASWITVGNPSGSGSGTVAITIAPAAGPTRSGTATIAGETFTVTQSPGCAFDVTPLTLSVEAAGGARTVNVNTDSGCAWTAVSHDPWITVTSGASGNGRGVVSFNVGATAGAPRTGRLTIGGQTVTVNQGQGCTYSVAPQALSVPSAGGSGTVTVTSEPGCAWTAASQASWITLASGASGSGTGTVTANVAAASGPARSGTMIVAGQTITVNQGQGCSYSAAPQTLSVASSGGSGSVTVTADPGCPWTASSQTSWITIASGASGSGNGTVTANVSATTGPGRSGTFTVAGQTITVNQGQGCSYSVAPQTLSVGSSGGNGSVTVTADAGCAWTAASQASWITISSGATGSGNGTVTATVAATSGPGRSGTVIVAGQTITVNQGQGCTFTATPQTVSVPSSGGSTAVNVTADAGCGWTATSQASWITIASGASGNGNGTVTANVAATTGPSRSGTLTVAGRTITVNQGQGCTFTLSPASASASASGGSDKFMVRTAAGCAWTATSQANWLTVTEGKSDSGNGNVEYAVAANPGPSRTGTIIAGGQTFTVTQNGGCSFTIAPPSQNVGSGGGTTSVGVTAAAGCAWTAVSHDTWITISSGNSGSGNGTVQLAVAANSGPQRNGTVTIAGQTFTVVEAGGCTATVTPDTIPATPAGGPHNVQIATAGDCAWSSTSNAPWISIAAPGSGTGNGTVQLGIAANTGPARSGTATIAAKTVTVNQESGCSVAIAPSAQNVPQAGASGAVTVTTAAGCTWTAVSNAAWITVTGGASGSGDGSVQYAVVANTTGVARTGTITIGGQTFTVNQPEVF